MLDELILPYEGGTSYYEKINRTVGFKTFRSLSLN